jgi:CPA1 family monovalent cation:H+ antiporter
VEGFDVVLAGVLVSVAVLNVVATRIGIPYPIVLVLGGLALGFVPGMPEVDLDPDLVLLVFLPPLLYVAAFFSELHAMRGYARALSLTSVGLVLLTTVLVAVPGHLVLDLPWPMAFALGAIVSPTDPVAATAIMRRLHAPRLIVNFVEGESLVNDAAALIAYRVAVVAAVEGRSRCSTPASSSCSPPPAVWRWAWRWGTWSARSAGASTIRRPRSRSAWSPATPRSCPPSSSTSRACCP